MKNNNKLMLITALGILSVASCKASDGQQNTNKDNETIKEIKTSETNDLLHTKKSNKEELGVQFRNDDDDYAPSFFHECYACALDFVHSPATGAKRMLSNAPVIKKLITEPPKNGYYQGRIECLEDDSYLTKEKYRFSMYKFVMEDVSYFSSYALFGGFALYGLIGSFFKDMWASLKFKVLLKSGLLGIPWAVVSGLLLWLVNRWIEKTSSILWTRGLRGIAVLVGYVCSYGCFYFFKKKYPKKAKELAEDIYNLSLPFRFILAVLGPFLLSPYFWGQNTLIFDDISHMRVFQYFFQLPVFLVSLVISIAYLRYRKLEEEEQEKGFWANLKNNLWGYASVFVGKKKKYKK